MRGWVMRAERVKRMASLHSCLFQRPSSSPSFVFSHDNHPSQPHPQELTQKKKKLHLGKKKESAETGLGPYNKLRCKRPTRKSIKTHVSFSMLPIKTEEKVANIGIQESIFQSITCRYESSRNTKTRGGKSVGKQDINAVSTYLPRAFE